MDPLAEKYPFASPYNYVLNNPINMVDPDGRSPFDWIKNKSTGQVVWDATATSPTNTPTGYDYVGKSYQGITILNYGAHSTRGAGVEIEAGYDDGKSTSPNARWVQTVRTNDPLGGATSPYNDPQPADDNKPFYWTDSELPSYQNTKGQDLLFYDRPTRSRTKNGVNWEGELSLVIDSGNGYQPQVTITYGFEIKGGVAVPTNPVVSKPSKFQSKTIDNYNATQIGPRLPDGSF